MTRSRRQRGYYSTVVYNWLPYDAGEALRATLQGHRVDRGTVTKIHGSMGKTVTIEFAYGDKTLRATNVACLSWMRVGQDVYRVVSESR